MICAVIPLFKAALDYLGMDCRVLPVKKKRFAWDNGVKYVFLS